MQKCAPKHRTDATGLMPRTFTVAYSDRLREITAHERRLES